MQTSTPSLPGERVSDRQPLLRQPTCPICQGYLVELRGCARCARCHFTICEGCEGGTLGNFPDSSE